MSSALPTRRSFRSALLVLVLGSLVLTVGTVGLLVFVSSIRTIEQLRQRQFQLTSQLMEKGVARLLDPAPRRLFTLQALSQGGMLPIDQPDQLGRMLADELRFESGLSWLSFGDAETGQFVGARRHGGDRILINQSDPKKNNGRPSEFILLPNGTIRKTGQMFPEGFDARLRPWFLEAAATSGLVWSDVYFFNEGVPGLTVSLAAREPDSKELLGVFTADYTLESVSHFLTSLLEQPSRLLALVSNSGALLGLASTMEGPASDFWTATLSALPVSVESIQRDKPVFFDFSYDNRRMLGVAMWLEPAEGFGCVALAAGDEREFFGPVIDNAWLTLWIGLLALIASAGLSFVIANRLAKPLLEISADLAKVSQFDLTRSEVSGRAPEEIAALSDSVEKMKTGLRSFSRYVPLRLVRHLLILGQEAELGGTERKLTLLFADLAGFTNFSEHLQPQEIVEEMKDYFELVTAAVEEQSGTLDKFIGDGVMAFFNAPHDLPEHVQRACSCSLAIQNQLREGNQLRDQEGRPLLHVRVGIHSGKVLVGNIGTSERFSYTALGDAVNLAARLEGLNKFYGTNILVTETVRDEAGGNFFWREVDRVAVVGRTTGTLVCELVGNQAEVPHELLQNCRTYEVALHKYLQGQFSEAENTFASLASSWPEDQATKILLARCRALLDEPPAEWNGIFIAEIK